MSGSLARVLRRPRGHQVLGSGPTDWFPSSLKTGLVLRVEPTAAGVVQSGGLCTNVINLVDSTVGPSVSGAARPTWSAHSSSGINTQPSLIFDGVANYMPTPPLGAASPLTLWMVAADRGTSNGFYLDADAADSAERIAWLLSGSQTDLYYQADTGPAGPIVLLAVPQSTGSLLRFKLDGANATFQIDSSSISPAQLASSIVFGGFNVGATFVPSGFAALEFWGLFGWSRALSSGEETTMAAAVLTQFNIS